MIIEKTLSKIILFNLKTYINEKKEKIWLWQRILLLSGGTGFVLLACLVSSLLWKN